MAPHLCALCHKTRASMIRPKNRQKLCKSCFITAFETEIHETITTNTLFHPGERIAIGASGGKDSTVLAAVLKTLNERYAYGLDLVLLSIDEGITGYRDDSLATVKRNAVSYDMQLSILGYAELYGWTMDEVVAQVGRKGNCTYCGVFRRQALDRGAEKLGVRHVVTGHNADDVAETVFMNLLRGDLPRLARGTRIVTETKGVGREGVKRSKPLMYAYEKEIVLYAHFCGLEYFSTECVYSPEAFRGSARALIKDLERVRPESILDILRSGEEMARLVPKDLLGSGEDGEEGEGIVCGSGGNGRASGGEMAAIEERLADNEVAGERETEVRLPAVKAVNVPDVMSAHDRRVDRRRKQTKQVMGQCERCGYMSSQKICKACMLLEGLNKNRPRTTIEVGVKDEEGSKTMMRHIVGLEVANG